MDGSRWDLDGVGQVFNAGVFVQLGTLRTTRSASRRVGILQPHRFLSNGSSSDTNRSVQFRQECCRA